MRLDKGDMIIAFCYTDFLLESYNDGTFGYNKTCSDFEELLFYTKTLKNVYVKAFRDMRTFEEVD
ncbi:MAG: hypothetical protein ACI8RD_013384 [Bacillariaceae sp.]|jgi:hypothetical protein